MPHPQIGQTLNEKMGNELLRQYQIVGDDRKKNSKFDAQMAQAITERAAEGNQASENYLGNESSELLAQLDGMFEANGGDSSIEDEVCSHLIYHLPTSCIHFILGKS